MKEIPEHFVDDISDTLAHEGCGQSVSYKHALGCGVLIGNAIKAFANAGNLAPISLNKGQNFTFNFSGEVA